MKFVDSFFAWSLLAYGFVTIIVIEMRHPAHAVLDTPILWVFVAMFNLLRIRDGQGLRRVKLFSVAANVIVLTVEALRWTMFGPWVLIAGFLVLVETIFSIAQTQEP